MMNSIKKLLQIRNRFREKIITNMCKGLVELAAMAPFIQQGSHKESLCGIALTIKYLDHSCF